MSKDCITYFYKVYRTSLIHSNGLGSFLFFRLYMISRENTQLPSNRHAILTTQSLEEG